MAVNISEEDTALISTCEVSDILTPSAPGIQDQDCSHARLTNRPRRKWPFRTFGSRKVLLILFWSFVVNFSQFVDQNTDSLSYYGKETASPRLVLFNSTTEMVAFAISCPIANLLAEVVVGRYNFISFILKAMWFIHVIGLGISVCEYCLHTGGVTSYMIGYCLIDIPTASLTGAFIAVTIPLGLDQIAGASTTNIAAYVVWYLWTIFVAIVLQTSLCKSSTTVHICRPWKSGC